MSRRGLRGWFLSGRMLSVLLLLLLLAVAWHAFNQRRKDPHWLPFTRVVVWQQGTQITQQRLRDVIMPYLDHGFFSLDEQGLTQRLQRLPWMRSVSLRKVWPGRLVLKIVEKQPLARWNQHGVLDQDQNLFYPQVPPQQTLPLLQGESSNYMQLWEQYQRLQAMLQPLEWHIARLELSAAGRWTLTCTNGVTLILGANAPEQRLARFISFYPKVLEREGKMPKRIDLRYPHGFVVAKKS